MVINRPLDAGSAYLGTKTSDVLATCLMVNNINNVTIL